MALKRVSFPHHRQLPLPLTNHPPGHVLHARLPTNASSFMLKQQAQPPLLNEQNLVLTTCPLDHRTTSRKKRKPIPRPPNNRREHGAKQAPCQQPFPSKPENTPFNSVNSAQKWDYSQLFSNTHSTNVGFLAQTLQKRPFQHLLTIFEFSRIKHLVCQQTHAFSDAIFQHSSSKMAMTRKNNPALDHSRFDHVCVTCQKHPNQLDLHNLWIGVFGFNFPFALTLSTMLSTLLSSKPISTNSS